MGKKMSGYIYLAEKSTLIVVYHCNLKTACCVLVIQFQFEFLLGIHVYQFIKWRTAVILLASPHPPMSIASSKGV